MKLWRMLGVAGLAGVAASGVIIARDRRRRAQVTPEEVRSRLHARLEDGPQDGPRAAGPEPGPDTTPPARGG